MNYDRTYQVLLPLHPPPPPPLRFHGDIVLHLPRQNCRHLERTRGSIRPHGSSACEGYCHCQSSLHWTGGLGTVSEEMEEWKDGGWRVEGEG